MELLCNSVILLLDIYLEIFKAETRANICIPMFIAALLTTAER
jgi:hypothetical protein